MSISRKAIRQTLTIARRDFIATVATPMFLFFLLAPLIFSSFSLIGGLGASSVAEGAADRERLVVVADAADAALLKQADERLRTLFSKEGAPATLTVETPEADPMRQARAALDARDHDVDAALAGPLDAPHIFYGPSAPRSADYLAALADAAVRARHAGAAPASQPVRVEVARQRSTLSGQHA